MCRAVPRLVSRVRVDSWLTGKALLSSWRERTRQQPWRTVTGPLKFMTWQTGGSRGIRVKSCPELVLRITLGTSIGLNWENIFCIQICSDVYLHHSLQLLWESGIHHSEGQKVRVCQPQIHLVCISLFHLEQVEQIVLSPSAEGNNKITLSITCSSHFLHQLHIFTTHLSVFKLITSEFNSNECEKILNVTCVWYGVQGNYGLSGFPGFLNWYDLCISSRDLAMNLTQDTFKIVTEKIFKDIWVEWIYT